MQTFTQNKIVLMYPEKPKENYYDEQYMFVDLDSQSGGYPTRATADRAHDFKNVEAAMKYKTSFMDKNFIVVEMQTTHNVIPL